MDDGIDPHQLERAAHCLRTIAHPHRLRMIEMLAVGEKTVGALARGCDIKSHVASQHLRLMKDRGLIHSRRDGRRVYYAIAEPGLLPIIQCIANRYRTTVEGDGEVET